MSGKPKSDVIRWRRSTWRARVITYAIFLATAAFVAWSEFGGEGNGPPFWVVLLLGVGFFVQRPLIRRWQVEVISPRPQTAAHKQAYRQLQALQLALLAAFLISFFWMMFASDGTRSHLVAAIIAGVAATTYLVSAPLFTAAYERLFRKIAQTDGAYGF